MDISEGHKLTKKVGFLVIIMLCSTALLVNAFYITDNFDDDSINTAYWLNYSLANNTGTAYELNGVAMLNGSGTTFSYPYNFPYFQTKQNIQKNQNATITFTTELRNLTLTGEESYLMLSDYARTQAARNGDADDNYCGVVLWQQNSVLWQLRTNHKHTFDLLYDFNIDDTNSHAVTMSAKRVINGTTNYTQYDIEIDGTPYEYKQTHPNCINNNQPILNYTFMRHTGGEYTELYMDSFIMSLDVVPTCTEPCLFNDTFSYDNSICENGWVSGECSDLNTPINNVYVCNDTSQVIAYYFGKVTKNSGIITIKYDLQIKSDYEVLMGIGDTAGSLAVAYYYDDGTIYDLRDNTNLTGYDFNTTYSYRLDIDIKNNNFDFWQDGLRKQSDIPFYTNTDNLYYVFIQPDYLKGYPYCDYELDNFEIFKGIAVIPESNETMTIGSYWNLNTDNPGFNEELACKENEHPTLCVYRATFEDLGGRFTNFVFNNFLLFLMLVFIILIMILFKKHSN